MAHTLVLVRHGQSDWNKKNLFTGWRDVELTDHGRTEAREAGALMKAAGFTFDISYTSALKRAQETNTLVLEALGQSGLPVIENAALNERDYGELTGLNKDDARAKWGEEQVHIWRRSFDIPPPGGESLKMTAERVLPYFDAEIMPKVRAGQRVLVTAHGNSLRALVMQLDALAPEEIVKVNIATGVPIAYTLDDAGQVISKQVLVDREYS